MFNQHHPAAPAAAHLPAPHRPPQQQQQFHQHMMQLQQLLHQHQQQQQHRSHPRVLPPGARGIPSTPQPQQQPTPPPTPHPQAQMMTMRATSHATILGPNPMLQQALFMQRVQGSMRGFAVGPAPAMQQFFAHTRHSILGTPPIGISVKPPQMGFPGLPFQQQNRLYYKDYLRTFERKRELEPGSSSQAKGSDGQPTEKAELDVPKAASEAEHNVISPAEPEGKGEPASEEGPEPSAKRLKSLDDGGCDSETIVGVSQEEEPDSPTGLDSCQECEADCIPNERSFSVDSKTIETPSAGSSLKVTIQQRSESRAISTTAQKAGPRSSDGTSITQLAVDVGPRFFCYICKANYHNQEGIVLGQSQATVLTRGADFQDVHWFLVGTPFFSSAQSKGTGVEQFQSHMATAEHQHRLQEIQHISNSCLVTFMPVAKDNQYPVAGKDGRKTPLHQRWCNACQIHFSGDLIQHRRTSEHKLAKHSLRPFCTVCSRHFKTPRKFVEHMKSPEHKQKAKEERLAEKEPAGPEDAEELITVDAVGCFEDDEEEEEEEGTGEEENADAILFEDDECITRQSGVMEEFAQECEEDEEYSADTVYGLDFVVPVAGYLCRLCHKFYPSDSAARLAHCKSLMHFQNVQKQRTAKNRVQSESKSCPSKPGTSLEDDLTPCPTSDMNVSQGPEVEGSILHGNGMAWGEDGEDKDGVPLTAEDSENENPWSREEHGGEEAEEEAESLLKGYQPLEEEDSSKEDLSPSLCRRSSRRKTR